LNWKWNISSLEGQRGIHCQNILFSACWPRTISAYYFVYIC
jgi:hypothetical protein